jgi:ParB family chromosome partitioning protein
VDLYLGRVSKARILQAVREGKGERAAERIAHLKKGEMAGQAQELLAGSGWLPEPLRTPGQAVTAAADTLEVAAEAEQPSDIVSAKAVDEQPAEDPAADATEDWQSAAD